MSFLSKALGSNVDKSAAVVNYSTPGFSGGGLTGSFNGNNYSVTPDANRTSVVGDLSGTYGYAGDAYGALRPTVAPGGSDALNAQLTDIGNQAPSAIGDLRQNLQSRRILGSSFGQDTISRLQNTVQQTRDSAIAKQYQTDLQNSVSLIGQQYDAYSKEFSTKLSELNLEGNLASSLSSSAAQILAANAQTQAKLTESGAEQNAKTNLAIGQGVGQLAGKLFGGGFDIGGSSADPGSIYNVNNGYVPSINGGGVVATR